jgi:hypothetical protein
MAMQKERKKYGHEGQVQKRKNDEHIKAHVLKKRKKKKDSHVSK